MTRDPFRYCNSSPEVIRLAAMMYDRYPLSQRQVEDLLTERGFGATGSVRCSRPRFGSGAVIIHRIPPGDGTETPQKFAAALEEACGVRFSGVLA